MNIESFKSMTKSIENTFTDTQTIEYFTQQITEIIINNKYIKLD